MATRPTPLIDEEPTGQGKDHTHTDRLSYRGMGEVMPVDEGAPAEIAEGELTASRRVEFHIVRQLHPLDPTPIYWTVPRAPWTEVPTEPL